ncbi:unnamed protein product [Effrenium voratum]|nr:unnamed protein product [Effrenium voratum]
MEQYDKALEKAPDDLTYHNNKCAVWMEMGEENYPKVLKTCEDLISKRYEINSRNPGGASFEKVAKVYTRMASVYEKQKRFDEAIAMYNKALTEDNNRLTRNLLREAERAKEKYEKDKYLDSAKAEEHREKGNALFKANNMVAAKQEYDEAIRRNPKDAKLYSNRAATFTKLLAYPDALRDLEECLKLEPTFVKAYSRKGAAHFFLKEYHKALEAYEAGLKLEKDNEECQRGREQVIAKIMETQSDAVDEEQVRHAMADPEIQKMLHDPQVRMFLKTLQESPAEGSHERFGMTVTYLVPIQRCWAPRSLADFGDGGAFPEIHMAQCDFGMSLNGKACWKHGLTLFTKDKLAVWTRPEHSREKWSKPEELERPSLELDILNTERTQKALEMALNGKIQAGVPKKQEQKEAEFIRYTPNPNAPGYTPNCRERVIKLVERQIDPFQPPKFKHKKVPRGPPSPPPPVHHSPPKKLTAKDQKDWKIPPCISNWKNAKGYTIPLDKRLSADGRSLQDVAVNDKFAAISEDLYLAERKAREEIKIRNDLMRQKKVREEEIREQQLRDLAAQARVQRAELAAAPTKDGEEGKEAEDRRQRMEVLKERQREIERDQRLELAGMAG